MTGIKQMRGFSLVELLMALTVMVIVLAAVVTLSYALNVAFDGANDISEKQAEVRYATFRLTELIKHSRLVCARLPGDLVVWRADDNGDNQINVSEIVYIETGYSGEYIRLLQFYPGNEDFDISLGPIQWWYKNIFIYRYPKLRTTLVNECSGVEITLDNNPPYTTFVSIVFDVEENNQVRTYQISSTLRCWAGNLLRDFYTLVTDDD
ncbi:MAG: prepilin-type N-terminal cleavage/methylation domain-containing protein [Sedimentisphaerales bacterium]|nr:prepilin-type N-terminal cleavage/methylation domain-containing protein [Sedimentisphaerales bacterium]